MLTLTVSVQKKAAILEEGKGIII